MNMQEARKRIFGWMMFDWASQPYNTLLLTFIFGPYFASAVVGDPVQAQSLWGFAIGLAGIAIAVLAPILGAVADSAGRRMPYIWAFSIIYVVGSWSLWYAVPGSNDVVFILTMFCLGLIGMEFATIFTNAIMPELGDRENLGEISGTGWAVGYLGGLVALVLMMLFLAENENGVTLIGLEPAFGLDPSQREGTRSVGPLTAVWFAVFMIPFFLWVREKPRATRPPAGAVKAGLSELWQTILKLPRQVSFSAYLGSSMLYRDALNGMYTFGGIYAAGVLNWSVIDVGIFGIIAVITGAIFAYRGGKLDRERGPKPVIVLSILALILAAVGIVSIVPDAIGGVPVSEDPVLAGKSWSDLAFYFCGCVVGGAGGSLQAASRTMLVRQGNPNRMTEAFGLYAVAGKATAWLAPLMIGIFTAASDSQRIGVTPVIGLFLLGLVLLIWVRPDGEDERVWVSETA